VFNLSRGGCAIETNMYAGVDDPVSLQITVSSQPTPITIELGKCAGRPSGSSASNLWSLNQLPSGGSTSFSWPWQRKS
jgi:hypothetical protein